MYAHIFYFVLQSVLWSRSRLISAFYSPLSSAPSSKMQMSPASVLTLHRLPQQPFPQQPLPPALIAEQLGHSIWKRDKMECILHEWLPSVSVCVCVLICVDIHTFAYKYLVFMVHIFNLHRVHLCLWTFKFSNKHKLESNLTIQTDFWLIQHDLKI